MCKLIRIVVLVLMAFTSIAVSAQNKYGLIPTRYRAYMESVKLNPAKELIDLEKFVPGIVLDIRYATTNNFTKERIYTLRDLCV